MPLTEEQKSSTPFKTKDIKSLFKAASNRKRKATSPVLPLSESKSAKVCENENDDEDIKILDVPNTNALPLSDSKENKALKPITNKQLSNVTESISSSESDLKTTRKECNNNLSCDENSVKVSSDELNSSLLNSSTNVLNTSGVSEGNQDAAEAQNSSLNTETGNPGTISENASNKGSNPKKRKRMTPEEAKQRSEEREKKQQERLLKKQELEAKKKEREREIQERKVQKELEKKAKEDEKKAKEEERKEKERQRLEKKEQEEKEKQMKAEERESQKKARQMALEQKLEVKKQKEEIKQKQEEERKKAEEEKKRAELEKEQKEKEKKEKAKAAFMKFFVTDSSPATPPVQKPSDQEGVFKPFQVSEDMTLAPVVPSVSAARFKPEILDSAIKTQDLKELYLQILKSGSYKDVRYRKKLRKPKPFDADVIVMDKIDQPELNLRAKLLQFSENVRPPYWGTWRKRSKFVRPRNPFGQDTVIFDYEIDSEDEWDEGGPGESLSGTEQEVESEDDYEVDNEFFVPHGYLSAEEEKEDDEEGKEVINDPEKQKALLNKKLQEFEMGRKKKLTELKPIIIGCYIQNGDNPQNKELSTFLESYAVVILTENPIPTKFSVSEAKLNSAASSPTSATSSKSKRAGVPEEAMPFLISLIHGNTHSIAFLISEFQKFWQQHCLSSNEQGKSSEKCEETSSSKCTVPALPETPGTSTDSLISKRQLTMTFKQIATFRKKHSVESIKKAIWWVNEDILEKYGLKNIPIPNAWTYVTVTPVNKEETESNTVVKPTNASIKEFLTT